MNNKLTACILSGLMVAALLVSGGCNGGGSSGDNGVPKPPSSSELAQQGYDKPGLPRITAEELKIKYDNREPIVLVDTRPPAGYLSGYIPGARNIPNIPSEESFEQLAKLPKDRLIITYCDCMDDGESAVAAERLLSLGYTNVKILWKGIYYWERIGGEVRE